MASTASSAQRIIDTPNVTPFPFPDSVKSNNTANHDHDYNNNIRARTREILEIDEAYEDVFDRKMPKFVWTEIQGFIADGVEPKLIRDVIEYTACAPRPSWAYARAVLYRSKEKGIKTSGAFARSLAHRGRDGDCNMPY